MEVRELIVILQCLDPTLQVGTCGEKVVAYKGEVAVLAVDLRNWEIEARHGFLGFAIGLSLAAKRKEWEDDPAHTDTD